jgi:hypothetical protein
LWRSGVVSWSSIACIAGVTRRCGGLWRFLVAREEGRTAIELERERNRATAEALRLVAEGCELLEFEREGRLRVIRRPGQPTAVAGGAPGDPGGELGR